jgi:hypothetical protein
MKRWLILGVVVLALSASLVPAALAQGVTPPVPGADCPMWEQGARGGMMGRGGAMMGRAGLPDGALELLGLTAEEVRDARLAGKSLADIAADQGVDAGDLVDAILDGRAEALAALVKDSKLTQAQADLMLERMRDRVGLMVERDEAGPMWGDGDGRDFGPMWRDSGRGGMRGQGMRGGMRGRQSGDDQVLRYQSF